MNSPFADDKDDPRLQALLYLYNALKALSHEGATPADQAAGELVRDAGGILLAQVGPPRRELPPPGTPAPAPKDAMNEGHGPEQ